MATACLVSCMGTRLALWNLGYFPRPVPCVLFGISYVVPNFAEYKSPTECGKAKTLMDLWGNIFLGTFDPPRALARKGPKTLI